MPVTGKGKTSVTQNIAINATTYKHFIARGCLRKKREWYFKFFEILLIFSILTN